MRKASPVMREELCIGHLIFCPACRCGHLFYNVQAGQSARWTFNGDLDNPTFNPSMLIKESVNHPRCHSFVRNGKIEFLSNCTHSMAGQTVDLPEI